MKPWMVVVSVALLLLVLLAAFAAGPVAVFVMLERSSDSVTAPDTMIALEPAATVTDAEINRLFNDLRSQYLDDRAESITWWLMAAAISLAFITVFVTAVGIIIVIAGFVGYRWFRDILDDARRYKDEAQESANQAKTVVNEAQAAATDAVASATQASEIVEQIRQTREEELRDREAFRARTAEDVAMSSEPQDAGSIALGSVETTPVDHAAAEARRLQQQGDTAAAIEKWKAIASILEGVDDERAARAWFSIGYLYGQANEYELGISAYNAAIRLNPEHTVSAYNNLGVAKAALGRYEDAIADYDAVIRLDPENASAYNNRGNAKRRSGRYEDAIADCDVAIRLDPEYAVAYNSRGTAKEDMGHYEDAIADYGEAIRLNPEYALAYRNRGDVKASLGRYEDAIADYDEAIRHNSEYALAYCNRGSALQELDRTSGARADFEKALRLAEQQDDSDLKLRIEQALADLDRID